METTGILLSDRVTHGRDVLDFVQAADVTMDSQIPFSVTGRYGDIFLGDHRTRGRVALKRLRVDSRNALNEEKLRHFEREAMLWRSLRHPNILPFIGILQQDGHMYLLSPYSPQGTITSYALGTTLNTRETLLLGVAHGLAYLHEERIIHGDLKGSNVLVAPSGAPLLCDFGLSRLEWDATSSDQKGAGSVRWQSPELHKGGRRSFASDIYALGMTIYEVMTGEVPFHIGTNVVSVINLVFSSHAPRRLPKVTSSEPLELLLWPGVVTGPTCLSSLWPIANDCWQGLPSTRPSAADVVSRIPNQAAEQARRRRQDSDRRLHSIARVPSPSPGGDDASYGFIGRWFGSLTNTPIASADDLGVETSAST